MSEPPDEEQAAMKARFAPIPALQDTQDPFDVQYLYGPPSAVHAPARPS